MNIFIESRIRCEGSCLTSMTGTGITCFPFERLLSLAASVEQGSEHPLGKAIVREAQIRQLDLFKPQDFISSGGLGVAAKVDGSLIRVGKPYGSGNWASILIKPKPIFVKTQAVIPGI